MFAKFIMPLLPVLQHMKPSGRRRRGRRNRLFDETLTARAGRERDRPRPAMQHAPLRALQRGSTVRTGLHRRRNAEESTRTCRSVQALSGGGGRSDGHFCADRGSYGPLEAFAGILTGTQDAGSRLAEQAEGEHGANQQKSEPEHHGARAGVHHRHARDRFQLPAAAPKPPITNPRVLAACG